MSALFFGCKSLIKLPDISLWNTSKESKVTELDFLFGECLSLKSLPDISK